MNTNTKKIYSAMLAGLASVYAVKNVSEHFNVVPSVAQTLNDESVESVDFLQKINIVPVKEIKGQKVAMGINDPITGRTNTNNNDRATKDASSLKGKDYELFPTESDVHMGYIKIDSWAKFKDFYKRYKKHVQHRISLDRLIIGFNGTSVATETNLATNPLLQDVNKGWLQHVRDDAPGQIYPGESNGSGGFEIKLGATGDYKNLDALTHSLLQLIDTKHRGRGDLVVIVGSDLLAREKANYYENNASTPSEKIHLATKRVMETYGGLPAYEVPYFPSKGLMITTFDNLSIYWQQDSWRRAMIDNPKRNRVEDYNSRNEGYVVEDYELIAAIESDNVVFV